MNKNKNILFLLILISTLISCGKDIENSENKKKTPKTTAKTKDNKNNETKLKERKEKLYNAILADSPGLVKTELEANENIDFFFDDGNTPLTLALKYSTQNGSIISSMIMEKSENKKIANTKNAIGEFPLFLATKSNNLYVLNILLKVDIKINQKTKYGNTALSKALEDNNLKFAKLLLIHGGDFHTENASGISPFKLASWFQYKSILSFMSKIDQHKEVKVSNLLKAINRGDSDFVRYLLTVHKFYQNILLEQNIINRVIDLNKSYRSSMLSTILRYKKLNIDLNDGNNPPALIYAADKGQLSTIKKLLANGASPTVKDNYGRTALDYAAASTNYLISQLLYQKLENSPNLDQRTFDEIIKNSCHNIPSGQTLGITILNLFECYRYGF